MIKRDELSRANKLHHQLQELEGVLTALRKASEITVSHSAISISLRGFERPSKISDAFDGVKTVMIVFAERQIAEIKNELINLGVEITE